MSAASEDEEMAGAMARARASFKYLWRELTWEYRRIVPALELSAIKAAFNDPGGPPDAAEHMWLSEIEFDGEVVRAKLLNSPNGLDSFKEGDSISLSRDQIEDWMFALSGCCYGGFTIQLLRSRMSRSERKAHDEAWGLEFAEPDQIRLSPNWAEKKQRKASKPADPDAEHPMSENMAKELAAAIARDRPGFIALDDSGLNTLHSLALGGSAACVKALLEAGVDARQKTRSGKTARELALMMGWPRVVSLLSEAEQKG